jgi:ABC-type bacteriocin/lantibiotic exporter with double-glycine peptidase domain
VPFVSQVQLTDCAAACVAMTLAYHGRPVPLAVLAAETAVGRDGTTALALLQTARRHGLRGWGVRAEVEDLQHLPAGSILHWELDHYVVLQRVVRGAVEIVDPAAGHRRVPPSLVRRAFTGVAIVLEPDGVAPAEVAVPRSPSRRRLWGGLAQHGAELRRTLVASAAIQLAVLSVPLLVAVLVERILPAGDGRLLAVLSVGVGVVVGYSLLALVVRGRLLLELRTRLDARLSTDFVEHLLDLPYPFFLSRSAGDLLARRGGFAVIRETLTASALSGVIDGLLVVGYVAVLAVVSPVLAGLVVVLAAAQVAVLLAAGDRTRRLTGESLAAEARSAGYLTEVLAGIETLKAGGAEQRAMSRWRALFDDELNAAVARGRLDGLVHAVLDTLRIASPLVVLVVGGWLSLGGRLGVGEVVVAAVLASAVLQPLAELVTTGLQLRQLDSYLHRLDDVLGAPTEHEADRPAPARPVVGRITARGLGYRYSAGGREVLTGIDVDIAPGSRVALVGPSGSGKSTLALLLLGLHRPTAGQVLVDGTDLTELDLRALRQQIGVVTQRSYVFAGTIRDNLALTCPDADLDQQRDAARLALVDDDIAAMALGYDTVLVDGGASLSGGQRQRLCLARALVGQPRVLLLDEATSALDAVTEHHIHRNIANLGVTTVIIAHRLSTIRDADRILVLRDGHLVEDGTHDSLMAAADEYSRLLANQ